MYFIKGNKKGRLGFVESKLCSGQWVYIVHQDPHALPVPHHGPGIRTAVPLCQVPQVDRELVESVVAQVPVGQDAVKEGKSQRALALQSLK